MDHSRYSLLTEADRDQLAYGADALVVVGPTGSVTIYHPQAAGDTMIVDRKLGRLDDFIAVAETVGVVIIDARSSDFDAFVAHTIAAPLPAIGRFAHQKISFDADGLGWICAADYARSFAVVGARIVNAGEAREEQA